MAVINTRDGVQNPLNWRPKLVALRSRYATGIDYDLAIGLMERLRNPAAHELLHGLRMDDLDLAFKGLCEVVAGLVCLAIGGTQDYPEHIDSAERTALLAICPP